MASQLSPLCNNPHKISKISRITVPSNAFTLDTMNTVASTSSPTISTMIHTTTTLPPELPQPQTSSQVNVGAIAGGAIAAFAAIAIIGLLVWYKIRTHPPVVSGELDATEQYASPGGDRPQYNEAKREGVVSDSERGVSGLLSSPLIYPEMPEAPSGRVAGTGLKIN